MTNIIYIDPLPQQPLSRKEKAGGFHPRACRAEAAREIPLISDKEIEFQLGTLERIEERQQKNYPNRRPG
jgi:hypothetical protein